MIGRDNKDEPCWYPQNPPKKNCRVEYDDTHDGIPTKKEKGTYEKC